MHSYIEKAIEQGNTMEVNAATLLMITTGRKLIIGNYQGTVSPIFKFMVGEHPFTHQIGAFNRECKPYLIEWYPELDAGFEAMNKYNWEPMLSAWLAENPATFIIAPIPADDHTQLDPVESLADMLREAGRNPDDVIITIDVSDDEL